MKKLSLLLVLLTCFALVRAQQKTPNKIVIVGKVLDTITKRTDLHLINISVNDTISRLLQSHNRKSDSITKIAKRDTTKLRASFDLLRDDFSKTKKLMEDTTVTINVKPNESFKIEAHLKDTLFFKSLKFSPQKHAVSDLIKLDSIVIQLIPKKCTPVDTCKDKNPKMYVIIAEKIALKPVDQYYCNNVFMLDLKYEATYKVIKNISGELKQDTVRFTVYDHYGRPNFGEFKHVLLFLSEHCNQLYHEKYQYFDVYPTRDGRWARPGDPYALDQYIKTKIVKAAPIKFKKSVVFNRYDFYPHEVRMKFTSPYFKVSGDKIYPIAGVYIEELLEIKKAGALKGKILDAN